MVLDFWVLGYAWVNVFFFVSKLRRGSEEGIL